MTTHQYSGVEYKSQKPLTRSHIVSVIGPVWVSMLMVRWLCVSKLGRGPFVIDIQFCSPKNDISKCISYKEKDSGLKSKLALVYNRLRKMNI